MAGLNEDQLIEIRHALNDGKQVWINDGQVRVAANASGEPMSGPAWESYMNKLHDIDQHVQNGWNLSITPDGTITGNDNKGGSMRASVDPSIDQKAMDFAHSAINGGQQVRIEPDGTMVATTPQYDPGYEPDAQQIQMSIHKFDEAVSSGSLQTLHNQGAAVTFEPNATQTEEIPLAPPSTSGTPTADLGPDPSSLDDAAPQVAAAAADEPAAAAAADPGTIATGDQPAPSPAADLGGPTPSEPSAPSLDDGQQTPQFDDQTMNDPSVDDAPSTLDVASSDDPPSYDSSADDSSDV